MSVKGAMWETLGSNDLACKAAQEPLWLLLLLDEWIMAIIYVSDGANVCFMRPSLKFKLLCFSDRRHHQNFPSLFVAEMPALHRSFNPYSSAPPPPASLPQYIIPPSTIQPLSNSQAGELIDAFLQTQGGKVLTLHRLADHLLGRTQVIDDSDIKELEDVLEEERRREGGVVHIQPDDTVVDVDDVEEETSEQVTRVPDIKTDKKRLAKKRDG